MRYDIFGIVKRHIDKMDYYSLLSGGAPKNEFDSESGEISKDITINSSVSEIAEIIADVFNKNFGENDPAVIFIPVAEKIKGDIDKFTF